MNAHEPLRGVLAPNLTAFGNDLELAEDLFAELAKWILDDGCVGLVPFGTTGEALSLGMEERISGLKALIDAGIDPQRLIPGTGLTNLPDTVRLTEVAGELGCRGALVLPPFFYKSVSANGLYAYFSNLAERTARKGFGIYLYHIPQVSGVGIPVEVVRRLHADFPELIVGIKDSSRDWVNTSALLEIPGFQVYPGNELQLTDALALGAPGCITATANVNAAAIAEVIRLYRSGNVEDANLAMASVREYQLLMQEYAPIPAMKFLLSHWTGKEHWKNVRPPLLPTATKTGLELARRITERFGEPMKG